MPNSPARITPYGAAGCVTGSSYLIEAGPSRVLLDFGMFQGKHNGDLKNEIPKQLDPARLDAVILTHAHLDHVGRLPLLAKAGAKPPIYATPATIDMAGLILRDSAKVQAYDVQRTNRQRLRAGESPEEPLYSIDDVERTLSRLRPVEYHESFEPAPGIRARFMEAGHMLGSASVELRIATPGGEKVAIFSGDLGPDGAPILRDSEPLSQADLVVLESTYGDRDHRPLADTVEEFRGIVADAIANKARVLVPSFAVGRTQQIVYHLAELFHEHRLEPFPVWIDSPMATEATEIYQHHTELYDEEATRLYGLARAEGLLKTVRYSVSADDSKALNNLPGPCLIMAGAGMCNAGRILHHFRNGLWKEETRVIMVGFQAEGTLGRELVDGARKVHIFGETVAVRASIHTLNGFSAHAGQSELLRWFSHLAPCRPQVLLTHGEQGPRTALAAKIQELHGITCTLPSIGESIRLG